MFQSIVVEADTHSNTNAVTPNTIITNADAGVPIPKRVQTYAEFNPDYYNGLCKGFASQLDNANDWLTHVLMVQAQQPRANYGSMIEDAIAHVHKQAALYADLIERLNKPIKK